MALPTNNAQLFADPDAAKDRFYLSGSLQQTPRGYEIQMPANGPIIAEKQDDAAEAGALFRKDWDNPEARANLAGVSPNMRMIGAGGIVSVQCGNEEPRTILFEKTAGPSKGRMAQASGLSDQNPLHVMWEELAEETGILVVDRKNKKLSLVVLVPSNFQMATFINPLQQAAFFDRQEQTKRAQIETIREQLPKDMRGWTIDTVRKKVQPNKADNRYLSNVKIILPDGSEVKTRTLVSDSLKTANVNLLMPVVVPFAAGTDLMFLDPEVFKRPVQTFTRAEMLTPDFIANKSSVPMRPYLTEAAIMELALAPKSESRPDDDGPILTP